MLRLTPYSPVSWLVIAHRFTSMFLAFLSSVVTRPVTPKTKDKVKVTFLVEVP